MSGIITLLTDFGTADSYVAEMKAVILSRLPGAIMVDITHDVMPGDVDAAQYLFNRTWHRFPAGAVHLAVVDPGVGSARKALALRHAGHCFIGPDNGLFSSVLDDAEVIELAVPREASPTFHGRDIFAPAAAALASGSALTILGQPYAQATRSPLPAPLKDGDDWAGAVMHVDRFGNLVSNLTPGSWRGDVEIRVGRTAVGTLRRTFADVDRGQLVAYIGSGGTVEVAVRNGSAKATLRAGVGTKVMAKAVRD